jgi:hypothetical protein
MEWLREVQLWFREPVYGFLGTYWPVVATILLIAVGWFVGSMTAGRRSRDGDGGVIFGSDSDSDGDGGGGAGGGD